jgi:hypothetical protein
LYHTKATLLLWFRSIPVFVQNKTAWARAGAVVVLRGGGIHFLIEAKAGWFVKINQRPASAIIQSGSVINIVTYQTENFFLLPLAGWHVVISLN